MLRHCNQHLPVKLASDTTQYDINAVLSHIIKHGSECLKAFATSSFPAAEKNMHKIGSH